MPGQPRDSYDTVVRKLSELDRRMEIQERHRHPTGRNTPPVTGVIPTGYFVATPSVSVVTNTSEYIDVAEVGELTAVPIGVTISSGKLLLPIDGVYQFTATQSWGAVNAAGRFNLFVDVTLGSAAGIVVVIDDWRATITGVSPGVDPRPTLVRTIAVNAGTTIRFGGYQNSGGTRSYEVQGRISYLGEGNGFYG